MGVCLTHRIRELCFFSHSHHQAPLRFQKRWLYKLEGHCHESWRHAECHAECHASDPHTFSPHFSPQCTCGLLASCLPITPVLQLESHISERDGALQTPWVALSYPLPPGMMSHTDTGKSSSTVLKASIFFSLTQSFKNKSV
jgi:hypothetical protein